MNPIPFHPKERVLAPPTGTHKDIAGLRVVDIQFADGTPAVVSCWQITDDELEQLQRDRRIFLGVQGGTHPPVMLSVNAGDFGFE